MKKYVFCLLLLISACLNGQAGNGDAHLNLNVGIFTPNTLDATIGYEHPVSDSSCIEIFGEAGDHWQYPVCCQFWKGWFWDGGLNYKYRLKKFKNGAFKIRGGAYCGSDRGKVFCGIEAGFEYNYIFKNQLEFSIVQKNNFNFIHGDTFRNGLMFGLKIPF